MPTKKLNEVVNHTYDVRLEGQEWRRELSKNSAFHAVSFAYKQLPDNETDMLFVLRENWNNHKEHFFCMPYLMWDALCETPEVMGNYLRIFR